MHRQNQAKSHAFISTIRRLLRAVGLMDGTPFSVKNSRRRLPQTRAALVRSQIRSPNALSALRVWNPPAVDLQP